MVCILIGIWLVRRNLGNSNVFIILCDVLMDCKSRHKQRWIAHDDNAHCRIGENTSIYSYATMRWRTYTLVSTVV